MNKIPHAKVIAMVNDLSTASLISLFCLYPSLEQKTRDAVIEEYLLGKIEADVIADEWKGERR